MAAWTPNTHPTHPTKRLSRGEVLHSRPMVVLRPYPVLTPGSRLRVGSLVRIYETQNEYSGTFGHVAEVDERFIWVELDLRHGLDYVPVVPIPTEHGVRLLSDAG